MRYKKTIKYSNDCRAEYDEGVAKTEQSGDQRQHSVTTVTAAVPRKKNISKTRINNYHSEVFFFFKLCIDRVVRWWGRAAERRLHAGTRHIMCDSPSYTVSIHFYRSLIVLVVLQNQDLKLHSPFIFHD